MKEMGKGMAQDVGKLAEGVQTTRTTPTNPGNATKFYNPVNGGKNDGEHPAKHQPETLRYIHGE